MPGNYRVGGPFTLLNVAPDLTKLANDARHGDAQAFAGLVNATHPDVWRLCAYLVDAGAADDLSQETFLRAFRSLGSFRGEAPVRAWLLTIARRVCAAEVDARVRRRELALRVAPLVRSRARFDGRVDAELLVADLADDRRIAFVLTQVIGCDYAEAAAICEVPIGTIRSRVARAREDLVKAMNADVDVHQMRPTS